MYDCEKKFSLIKLPMLNRKYTNEANPDKYMEAFYKDLYDFNRLYGRNKFKLNSNGAFALWKINKERDLELINMKLETHLEDGRFVNTRNSSCQTDEIIVEKKHEFTQTESPQKRDNEQEENDQEKKNEIQSQTTSVVIEKGEEVEEAKKVVESILNDAIQSLLIIDQEKLDINCLI